MNPVPNAHIMIQQHHGHHGPHHLHQGGPSGSGTSYPILEAVGLESLIASNLVSTHPHLQPSSSAAAISSAASAALGSSAGHSSMTRDQYVTQTLHEIMNRPTKKQKNPKPPYARQVIPMSSGPMISSNRGRGGHGSHSSHVNKRGIGEEHYNVFIPKKSLTCNMFNASVNCRGCNKKYAGTIIAKESVFGEPNFFIHCVKECDRYKELGLIRKCDDCSLLFMNPQSERKHHSETHKKKKPKKPFWMSEQVYRVRAGMRCNTKVSCSACGRFFGAQNSGKAGKISYSLDYLIHCIQDCQEYQKLGLVQSCPTCNCKFLNRLSLSQHKLKSKH